MAFIDNEKLCWGKPRLEWGSWTEDGDFRKSHRLEFCLSDIYCFFNLSDRCWISSESKKFHYLSILSEVISFQGRWTIDSWMSFVLHYHLIWISSFTTLYLVAKTPTCLTKCKMALELVNEMRVSENSEEGSLFHQWAVWPSFTEKKYTLSCTFKQWNPVVELLIN
jgi:hypothetical protein